MPSYMWPHTSRVSWQALVLQQGSRIAMPTCTNNQNSGHAVPAFRCQTTTWAQKSVKKEKKNISLPHSCWPNISPSSLLSLFFLLLPLPLWSISFFLHLRPARVMRMLHECSAHTRHSRGDRNPHTDGDCWETMPESGLNHKTHNIWTSTGSTALVLCFSKCEWFFFVVLFCI